LAIDFATEPHAAVAQDVRMLVEFEYLALDRVPRGQLGQNGAESACGHKL